MKRYFKLHKLFLFALSFALFGCSDFIDEIDQDKLRPKTTEHYAAVLLQEFAFQTAYFGGIDFMTDNITEYTYSDEKNRKSYKPIYTWQREIELDENGNKVETNKAWQEMYKDIAIANYVIELVDDALGSQNEIDFIKGEAYFVRAWSYFHLTNLYGIPYSESTAKIDLAVPIRTKTGVETIYSRDNVYDCYQQIIGDLTEAKNYIEKSTLTKSKYHPSLRACNLLLSRVYLYMKDWKNADKYASLAMENIQLPKMTNKGVYLTESNSDLIYSCFLVGRPLHTETFDKGWKVSPELVKLYNDKDSRFVNYFTKISGKIGTTYYTNKQMSSFSEVGFWNLRLSEAYLNRAEARCHLNNIAGAIDDMRTLLEKRYPLGYALDIPSDAAEMLDFVLVERRKELCFEGHHRWFDIRRSDKRKDIVHTYTLTDEDGVILGTESYVLLADDLNYTLPIPLLERENNPLIRNNNRYDKLPETNVEM